MLSLSHTPPPAASSRPDASAQVHAAAAGGKAGPSKVVSAAGVDEDHFADVELDDALLPN